MPVKPLTKKTDFNIAVGNLRYFLSLIAIWPKMRQTLTLNIIWFVYFVGFFIIVSGSCASAAMSYGNLQRFLDILGQTVPLTGICLKYVTFKSQIKPLKYFLKTMEIDWERQNQNSPEDKNTTRYRQIMVTHARGARIFFNVYIIVVWGCFSLYVTETTIKKLASNDSTDILDFPLKSWYPLPSEPHPFYEIMYTFEVVFGSMMAITLSSIDSLLVMVLLHLCGQFEILRCRIEEFRIKGRSIEMMHEDLKLIVNHHLSLLESARVLESSFNLIVLGQLLESTVHICVAGFILILAMESQNPSILRLGLLVLMALQEMFTHSFAGDYLTSQAHLIRVAIYKVNWYELPPSVEKSFILIMMRASKPVTITAGKFYPMSLNGFTGILKTSASYLSVLRAMTKSG